MTTDLRPHSRACGIRVHPHGNACHSNCPTCGARPVQGCVAVGESLLIAQGPRPPLDCVLPAGHQDPWHQASSGAQWCTIVRGDE